MREMWSWRRTRLWLLRSGHSGSFAALSPRMELPVANREQSFREFEHAGWENTGVVANYHEHLSCVTTQSAQALLDAVGVRSGSRVLDVATGGGYIAGAAAQRGAEATGIDFSATQLQMARDNYPTVRFEQADAEALPFAPQYFDAVVNGFGMCHFSNPVTALSEAFRVLKTGGRVAFTVWDIPERAVAFGEFYSAVRSHGSMDVGLPAGPNFFLFSDPEQSTKALVAAGFVSASCRQVPQVWRVSEPDKVFQSIADGSVRAAATLRGQSPAAREAIRASMRDAMAAYRRGDVYEVPVPAVLATAV